MKSCLLQQNGQDWRTLKQAGTDISCPCSHVGVKTKSTKQNDSTCTCNVDNYARNVDRRDERFWP